MKTWLVNTNTKRDNHNPNAFRYMLRQNKAAAYYDRAHTIDKIAAGDLVLLYHNDNRVIAVGCVVSGFEGHDFTDVALVEHWVDVNWLWAANFDADMIPTNAIDRNTLGITMVNNTVVNVSDQVDYRVLMQEIASRQRLF